MELIIPQLSVSKPIQNTICHIYPDHQSIELAMVHPFAVVSRNNIATSHKHIQTSKEFMIIVVPGFPTKSTWQLMYAAIGE